jgi:hypothetical protein
MYCKIDDPPLKWGGFFVNSEVLRIRERYLG